MFGNSDITWYPEYEIDLGGYVDEPPQDIEQLKDPSGLYKRDYVAGVVYVNSTSAPLSVSLAKAYKRATWSGGGDVDASGNLPTYSLQYTTDVPAGALQVPAYSAVILQDPALLPPPGVEPGGPTHSDDVIPADDLPGGMPGGKQGGGCCDSGGSPSAALVVIVLFICSGSSRRSSSGTDPSRTRSPRA